MQYYHVSKKRTLTVVKKEKNTKSNPVMDYLTFIYWDFLKPFTDKCRDQIGVFN